MAEERYSELDRRTLLIATSFACIITPLMSTMMNLSLISIGKDFDVGSHDQAYVNTLFLLGSVVSMVPAAKMASIKGMKKMFLFGLGIIVVCCILSFLSPDFWYLVIMRFLIGFGSSMVMVTSMAMLTFVFPISSRGKVLGINTTFVYIGIAVGPTIGGIITDALGWRYIFIAILIISAIAICFVSRFRKEIVPQPDDHMDWSGSVLWGFMIVLLMFGLINITESWAPYMTVCGLILFFVTIWYLKRHESPVLNVRMFRNRMFSRSCVAAFMNYGASYCITFFLALYLQTIGKMSATEAGMLMLVQPLMQVLLTMKMGALSDRMENKRLLPTLGMLITGIGVSMYLLLDTEYSLWLVLAIMVIIGVGLGIFSAPNNSLIMSSVEPHLKGQASGIVAVVRQTGMMVSMALAMTCISLIMGSTDNLSSETYGLFIDVIHTTFAVCTVMCFVGVVCSLIRIEKKAA